MLLNSKTVVAALCFASAALFCSGCSGPDDLLLHNHCTYDILVYSYGDRTNNGCSKQRTLLGTVPAHSTLQMNYASYGGKYGLCIACETKGGKRLGWINVNSPNVVQNGRGNGSVEFEVTILSPEEETLTASPQAVGLQYRNQ